MNKQIFKGQWREVKAKLQDQWSELTDNDLDKIKANNEEIYGILEKHYGYAKDEVKANVKEFLSEMDMPSLNNIKQMGMEGFKILKEKVRENPVKSFFIALSAIAVFRRITRSTHH